jgi:hypothetical protein
MAKLQISNLLSRVRFSHPAPKDLMFKVYWMSAEDSAVCQDFEDLISALAHTKYLRDVGRSFVTMVSENPDCVGKPGVDTVVDGKLPDGSNYEWKKRRK